MNLHIRAVGALTLGVAVMTAPLTAYALSTEDGRVATMNVSTKDQDPRREALTYLAELNEVRAGTYRALTPAQVAQAKNEDFSTSIYEEKFFDASYSDGKPRSPLKVNDDLMKWAQIRAEELASTNTFSHDNVWNGAPTWAYIEQEGKKKTNLLTAPGYVPGTFIAGPENLAKVSRSSSSYSPVRSWHSELDAAPGNDRQGYGHYLTNLSPLATMAGFGIASAEDGSVYYVLEIAYSDSEPAYTVEEALAALDKTEETTTTTPSAVETSSASPSESTSADPSESVSPSESSGSESTAEQTDPKGDSSESTSPSAQPSESAPEVSESSPAESASPSASATTIPSAQPTDSAQPSESQSAAPSDSSSSSESSRPSASASGEVTPSTSASADPNAENSSVSAQPSAESNVSLSPSADESLPVSPSTSPSDIAPSPSDTVSSAPSLPISSASDQGSQRNPHIVTDKDIATSSATIRIFLEGFAPNEKIDIYLHSDPIYLTSVNADKEGKVDAELTLPADVSSGEHHIVAVGVESGEVRIPLTIASAVDASGRLDGSQFSDGRGNDSSAQVVSSPKDKRGGKFALPSTGVSGVPSFALVSLVIACLGAGIYRRR